MSKYLTSAACVSMFTPARTVQRSSKEGAPVRRWVVGLTFGMAALCTLTSAPAVAQLASTTTYTPPRTKDGHPDLQGVWQVLNTAAWDLEDHAASLGVPAGHGVVEGGAIPYQPAAL